MKLVEMMILVFLLTNLDTCLGQQEQTTSRKLAGYAVVRLETDLSALSEAEKKMIGILIKAAEQMDQIFWMQAYGDRAALISNLTDADVKRFCEINYGPWDRLDDNQPFVEGAGEKPLGAQYWHCLATTFERATWRGST